MDTITRDTLGYRMALLARRWRQEVDATLKAQDMTGANWRPLLHLSHLGDHVRQKDLAESLGLDASSLVRLLDSLEARGLIRREDGEDRRTKLITLTSPGRAAMEQARTAVTAMERALVAGLNDEEFSQLADLLGRVENTLDTRRSRSSQNP